MYNYKFILNVVGAVSSFCFWAEALHLPKIHMLKFNLRMMVFGSGAIRR